MTTGKQLAGLLLLTSALTYPVAAFAQSEPGSAPVSTEYADAEQEAEEPEISIPGGDTIIVTGRVNRDPTRNSSQVISVLSSAEIARTGEGDIAGALNRVTGLSVVGNGRVFVRGLGDRYSLAMLNGLPLPSPEPLSRVVPLDIFPTNVIASSLVQKTYSPNYPGEFGGGVINLTTRAVPDESFLTIGASISGDTETTFGNGYVYFGSDTDWTGFDDGARDISAPLQAYLTDSINSGATLGGYSQAQIDALAGTLTPGNFAMLQTVGDIRPNFSGSLTAGTAIDVGADGRLGLVFTGSLKNSYRTRSILRQSASNEGTSLITSDQDNVTDNRVLANAMFSAGLEIGDHTIRWTNLFIRDTVKRASLADLNNFDDDFVEADFLRQNTAWFERQLIDTQLVGEFEFGPLSVDVRGGYARTDREAPYNLTYTYVRTNDGTELGDLYRIDLTNSGGQALQASRVQASFSDLNEELWFGGLDLSYEIADNFQATVGYAYSDTSRYTESRQFRLRMDVDMAALNPNNDPLLQDPQLEQALEEVLAYAGTRAPSLLFNPAMLALFNASIDDETATSPAFGAALTVHAGYGQFQWVPTEMITVQGGVRFETAEQSSTPIGVNNTGTGRAQKNDYWLPGATVTVQAADDLQLRVSGSKTIARPQFRELISQNYFDPETSRNYSGNPALVDSELLNFEARGEYYLNSRDRISLAGFYKQIDNPIEAYFTGNAISYANAPKATLYGAELDAQYSVDLASLGGAFESKQLVLVGNYTWTQSELSVGDEVVLISDGTNLIPFPASQIFKDGSPLIGQSDHLVNLQIGLDDLDMLQQLTLLVSYASERATFRNQGGLPDTVEKPGVQLDLVARQGITLGGVEAELKLEARNLLGTRHQEYLINSSGLRVDQNTYDVGQSFSAGLSVTF